MWQSLRKTIASVLILSTAHFGFVGAVQAAMIGTPAVQSAATATTNADDARARVQTFLARDDVSAQMRTLGVAPAEAAARVEAMSDDEVHALSQRLDSLPAGGDAFGTIITAAVVVFLVLLVTDILGYTRVFSFTRPAKH
jgi:hypothetical protein